MTATSFRTRNFRPPERSNDTISQHLRSSLVLVALPIVAELLGTTSRIRVMENDCMEQARPYQITDRALICAE